MSGSKRTLWIILLSLVGLITVFAATQPSVRKLFGRKALNSPDAKQERRSAEPVQPADFPATSQVSNSFGFLIWALGDPAYSQAYADELLSKAKEAGAQWIRMPFFLSIIEKEDGSFDFSRNDYVVARAKQMGFKLLGALVETSANNVAPDQAGELSKARPADLDHWASSAAKIVDRYKNDVRYWGIWNEPEEYGFKGDVRSYVQLLKKSYSKIKQLDSNLMVIMAGPDGEGLPEQPIDFLGWTEKFLRESGSEPSFDIIELHPFRYGTAPETKIAGRTMLEAIRAYRELFNSYGHSNKELWFTEATWPTSGVYLGTNIGVSEEQQADYLKYLFQIPENNPDLKITKIFWSDVKDLGDDPNNPDYNQAVVRFNGTLKKAFSTYQELARRR